MWLVIVLASLFAVAYGCFIAYWITRKKQKIKARNILCLIAMCVWATFAALFITFLGTLTAPSFQSMLGLSNYLEIVGELGALMFFAILPAFIYSYLKYGQDRKKAKETELKEKVKKEVKAELGMTEDGENADNDKNDLKQNNGNLLKKNKILTWAFLGCGAAFLIVGIIIILAIKSTAIGVVLGVVGLISLFVGFSAMMNRSRICPNCGECWGKEVDSKYMGSSTQIKQERISKSEYINNTSDNEKIVDKDGNYYKRTLVTTHSYEKVLQCEHCGHTWSVKEKKVEK